MALFGHLTAGERPTPTLAFIRIEFVADIRIARIAPGWQPMPTGPNVVGKSRSINAGFEAPEVVVRTVIDKETGFIEGSRKFQIILSPSKERQTRFMVVL